MSAKCDKPITLSSSKNNTMESKGPTLCPDFVKEELKCTVCCEVSVSPIQTCWEGHVVCGICFERVKACCICQKRLSRCPLAERLLKKYDVKIPCKNKEDGCSQSVKAWEYKDHLRACDFKPIPCILNGTSDCSDIWKSVVYNRTDLVAHLTKVHGIVCFDNEKTFSILSTQNTLANNTEDLLASPVALMRKHGHTFMLHEVRRQGHFYMWVTLLGSAEDAEPFNYTMKIYHNKKLPSKNCITWDLPVLAWEKVKTFWEAKSSGNIGSMLFETHLTICDKFVDKKDGKEFKYSWSTDVTIVPKDPELARDWAIKDIFS